MKSFLQRELDKQASIPTDDEMDRYCALRALLPDDAVVPDEWADFMCIEGHYNVHHWAWLNWLDMTANDEFDDDLDEYDEDYDEADCQITSANGPVANVDNPDACRFVVTIYATTGDDKVRVFRLGTDDRQQATEMKRSSELFGHYVEITDRAD